MLLVDTVAVLDTHHRFCARCRTRRITGCLWAITSASSLSAAHASACYFIG